MQPCYRRDEDLYLLAHVIREGDEFQQSCKVLISPGVSVGMNEKFSNFHRTRHTKHQHAQDDCSE